MLSKTFLVVVIWVADVPLTPYLSLLGVWGSSSSFSSLSPTNP